MKTIQIFIENVRLDYYIMDNYDIKDFVMTFCVISFEIVLWMYSPGAYIAGWGRWYLEKSELPI